MAGTQKTTAQLIAQLLATIYPNINNEIDAEKHQGLIEDLIASIPNLTDDANLFGLFPYDASRTYDTGQAVTYSGDIYVANQDGVTGAFDPLKWDKKTSGTAIEIRTNRETLVQGANTIAFSSALSTTNYEVIIYEVGGIGAGEATSKTVNGFDVEAIDATDIIYIAVTK